MRLRRIYFCHSQIKGGENKKNIYSADKIIVVVRTSGIYSENIAAQCKDVGEQSYNNYYKLYYHSQVAIGKSSPAVAQPT